MQSMNNCCSCVALGLLWPQGAAVVEVMDPSYETTPDWLVKKAGLPYALSPHTAGSTVVLLCKPDIAASDHMLPVHLLPVHCFLGRDSHELKTNRSIGLDCRLCTCTGAVMSPAPSQCHSHRSVERRFWPLRPITLQVQHNMERGFSLPVFSKVSPLRSVCVLRREGERDGSGGLGCSNVGDTQELSHALRTHVYVGAPGQATWPNEK